MITPDRKLYKKSSWPKKESLPAYKINRGSLSTLMTDEQKNAASIQDLSYDFACRIVRLFQYLNEDSAYKEFVISKQVYRSGTSIGANTREAQHAQSDADFLSKMQIAHKEADETCYWLSLLHDNGYLNNEQFIHRCRHATDLKAVKCHSQEYQGKN